jgi:hypothetical protein
MEHAIVFEAVVLHALAVLVITGVAVFLIVLLASLLSIRRVFIVDPAIVFRG